MQKTTSRPQTPASFALAIVRAYERRAMDPGPALERAGIDLEALRDPPRRIAIEPFEAFSLIAMRELDDEGLGGFSRRLPWGSYGMLLRASITAPTLKVALSRWCRHHGLMTEDVRLDLSVARTAAVIRVREVADLGPSREFTLVSLLRNFHGVACWLADSSIAVDCARFPLQAPVHSGAYERMFDGEITFDADASELRFDAAYLQLPAVRDDAALRRMLQQPISLMSRHYRQDRLLSQRICNLFSANPGQLPQADKVAEHLKVSVRSMQRKLKEEGTSLLSLKAKAQRQIAEELRLDWRRSIPAGASRPGCEGLCPLASA
jgi:hypothetical protein